MVHLLRGIAGLGLGIVLALSACSLSGDDGDQPAAGTSPTASTTTSTTTEPAAFPTGPADYTAELVRAWGVGDRTEAARFATPSAVDALFAFADPGGPRWELHGPCDGAGGTTYCGYRDPARDVVVLLGIPAANGNEIDGPQEVGTALIQPG